MRILIASATAQAVFAAALLSTPDTSTLRNRGGVENLPTMDLTDTETLYKLYTAASGAKSVRDFYISGLPVTADAASKLGTSLGIQMLNKMDATPGQPVTVVVTFLKGVVGCISEGKSASEAFECGKKNIWGLGDNMSILLPERCNNFLGQFEVPGTGGWPGRCHDPSIKQHPEGNSARRGILRSACKVFYFLQGSRFEEADRLRGKPNCDERFPSDDRIAKMEAESQLKIKMDKATIDLINFRRRLLDRFNQNLQVSTYYSDIEEAATYIAQGAFPSAVGKDNKEIMQLAEWFLGDLHPEWDLKDWVAAPEVPARNITTDDRDFRKAHDLIRGGPYAGLFRDSKPQSETCYSAAGLAEAQPSTNWDKLAAALGLIEKTLRKNQRIYW
ncbi:hypothetical protein VFPPC_00006 [Pochonia chlamydosporia 170]|uniref:Uncharacterized protein n=1 Tax=Pochonia chlamydosporia 170 TaxID=1380566 RepID=A0A179G462_METCM|nr:hypothetical protein VFPPC_00006 [Pochonia chlamydosporia 170]OAQ71929.2 hypothetical protein VFPPC_00006 [Pochonia chlamydosporia 170]